TALTEGNSIRSIERMTGIHRDTIMRLLVSTGNRCAQIMDETMWNLPCKRVQCDEIWTFVGKKARNKRDDDPEEVGDQWVFVALDADSKLIPSFVVGKRTMETTTAFLHDLSGRMANRIQLTTDGFNFYRAGVE